MPRIARPISIAARPEAVFPELVDLHRLTRSSAMTRSHDGPEVLRAGQELTQDLVERQP